MLKWGEIARTCSKSRFELLSQILNESHFTNEVYFYEVREHEFEETLKKAKQEMNQIRIGSPYGQVIGGSLEQTTSMSLYLKSADCLVKQEEKWWPRSLLQKSFLQVLVEEAKSLDISASAIIVGVGAAARALVLPLMNAGYSKILFTDKFEELGREVVQSLKKNYFNIEFRFVAHDEIAYLPGASSILINTTPYTASNDLLQDLYYFNFLNAKGWIVDLNYTSKKAQLIVQADDIGIPFISGAWIAATTDWHWCKEYLGFDLDRQAYYKQLVGNQDHEEESTPPKSSDEVE